MDNLNDYISNKLSDNFVTNCFLCNEEITVGLHDIYPQICGRCKHAWIKMRDSIEKSEQETTDDREKRIKEILEKLEQTADGRVIAKSYKDFCLNKNDKN